MHYAAFFIPLRIAFIAARLNMGWKCEGQRGNGTKVEEGGLEGRGERTKVKEGSLEGRGNEEDVYFRTHALRRLLHPFASPSLDCRLSICSRRNPKIKDHG